MKVESIFLRGPVSAPARCAPIRLTGPSYQRKIYFLFQRLQKRLISERSVIGYEITRGYVA